MTAGMPSESRIGCRIVARTRPRQVDSTAGGGNPSMATAISRFCVYVVLQRGERDYSRRCARCNAMKERKRKERRVRCEWSKGGPRPTIDGYKVALVARAMKQ